MLLSSRASEQPTAAWRAANFRRAALIVLQGRARFASSVCVVAAVRVARARRPRCVRRSLARPER
eukprot:6212242-Pleurochrysis_carterae.AAC.2